MVPILVGIKGQEYQRNKHLETTNIKDLDKWVFI